MNKIEKEILFMRSIPNGVSIDDYHENKRASPNSDD